MRRCSTVELSVWQSLNVGYVAKHKPPPYRSGICMLARLFRVKRRSCYLDILVVLMDDVEIFDALERRGAIEAD